MCILQYNFMLRVEISFLVLLVSASHKSMPIVQLSMSYIRIDRFDLAWVTELNLDLEIS